MVLDATKKTLQIMVETMGLHRDQLDIERYGPPPRFGTCLSVLDRGATNEDARNAFVRQLRAVAE